MSQRINYLDTAKLIGLALVCFCHIQKPAGEFHVWVFSFHMPLFFFLSGMFFKPENFSLKKCTMQLLVPFLLFNVLAILISLCLNFILFRNIQMSDFHLMRFFMSEYVIIPSWFLLSLFFIRMFFSYIYKYGRICALSIVTIVLLIMFVFTKDFGLWHVLSLGSSVLGLFFYLIGYIAKDKIIKYINYGGIWLTIFMIVVSCLAVFNGRVDIYVQLYGNNLIAFLFFGLVGSVVLIRLSQYIRVPHKILDTFMQGALFYICMHCLMLGYMFLIWNKATGDFSGNTLTEKIVVTILTFVISFPIIQFMQRYTPILLGKQEKK